MQNTALCLTHVFTYFKLTKGRDAFSRPEKMLRISCIWWCYCSKYSSFIFQKSLCCSSFYILINILDVNMRNLAVLLPTFIFYWEMHTTSKEICSKDSLIMWKCLKRPKMNVIKIKFTLTRNTKCIIFFLAFI